MHLVCMVNIKFNNAHKMLPKNIIKKMRQEDLRLFLLEKKKFMLPNEQKRFEKEILGQGSYPSGNELLVERIGKKIKFTNFD